MSLDTVNLLLGLAGLFLGLISAWGRIKAMTSSALRAGSNGARRWVVRRTERNRLFAEHPSAFLAYLARSFLSGLFILVIWRAVTGIIPSQLQSVVSFIAPLAVGALMGAVSNRCNEIITIFKTRGPPGDG